MIALEARAVAGGVDDGFHSTGAGCAALASSGSGDWHADCFG
jgi:hypothetical protein